MGPGKSYLEYYVGFYGHFVVRIGTKILRIVKPETIHLRIVKPETIHLRIVKPETIHLFFIFIIFLDCIRAQCSTSDKETVAR